MNLVAFFTIICSRYALSSSSFAKTFLYVGETCKYTNKENYVAVYRKNNIFISCVFNGFNHIYQRKLKNCIIKDTHHPLNQLRFRYLGSNLQCEFRAAKTAARIILHADFTTPSALMFKELGWLSVTNRLKHNKATLIYKTLNNKTPYYITIFKPISEVHTLNLWSSENGTLYVPRSRTSLFMFCTPSMEFSSSNN